MSETKEFTTIVRSQRRITLPKEFRKGDIVNIKAKKIIEKNVKNHDPKRDIKNS